MEIKLNGAPRRIDDAVTLGALVDATAPDRRGVAVAVDGEVVPRSAWDDVVVDEGTSVEIVGAVQGG